MLRNQKMMAASATVQWWVGCLDAGEVLPLPLGYGTWPTSAVPKATLFEVHQKAQGGRARGVALFWKEFIDMVRNGHTFSKRNRKPHILLPSLQQCKDAFRKYQRDPGWTFDSDDAAPQQPAGAGASAGAAGASSAAASAVDDQEECWCCCLHLAKLQHVAPL
jgi:hypothetical protein